MTKLDKYLLPIILLLTIVGGIYSVKNNEEVSSTTSNDYAESGSYVPIPSIQASENYGANFKTYKSELGFSFKYPPHLSVVAEYEGGYRLYLVANDLKPEDNTFSAIIISVANNNPTLTPKEWLNSSMSGYNKSNPYYRTEIDGEPATYTDGGMWFVVNTPDNKKRLSIASLRAKNGELLFSEMGILMESLTFDQ